MVGGSVFISAWRGLAAPAHTTAALSTATVGFADSARPSPTVQAQRDAVTPAATGTHPTARPTASARPSATAQPAATQQVVVLDPGHGGSEIGASDASGALREKDLTLRVALKTARYLTQMGYRVYLTRTRDTPVNAAAKDRNHDGIVDRVDEFDARNLFANAHHADVFVSIHFDGNGDPTVHGTHGFYCPARPFWRQSETLANLLTTAVTAAVRRTGYADLNKGVETDVADVVPQTRADYPWFLVLGPSRAHWLTGTAMPGALLESMYLTNPQDAAALRRPATITALAKGYAAGISAYLRQSAH